MRQGGGRGTGSATAVIDAGIVLVRLDQRHRSHQKAVELFQRSARNEITLHISAVNLAEVLQHARGYSQATGLDPVALLASFKIGVHSPDIETARRVADLTHLKDASLADRFAVATTELIGNRLYTTDHALAAAARKRKVAVTLYEK